MDELEFVLKKVIQIDNKAIELQNRTEQTIDEKESLLNEKIKSLEEKLIGNSNTESEREVKKIIGEAQNEAQSISAHSKGQCESIQGRYVAIKNQLKQQICNEMIEKI